MNKKIALAIATVTTILLASFAFWNVPSVQGQSAVTYVVVGGTAECCTHMIKLGESLDVTYWTIPYTTRGPDFTPGEIYYDREVVSGPDGNGIVTLNYPKEDYHGIEHIFYDTEGDDYYKVTFADMKVNGSGWLFTTDDVGDVDIITFTNDTGTYFYGPDGDHNIPKDSTWDDDLPVMDSSGNLLQLGIDDIPGSGDEPAGTWGDGDPDPKGSIIAYFPLTIVIYIYEYIAEDTWTSLMAPALFPELMTTGRSNNTIIEPASALYPGNPPPDNRRPPGSPLISNETVGQPMEYLSSGKAWGHAQADDFAIFACCWSWLNIDTVLGDDSLDLYWKLRMVNAKKTIWDAVTGDVDLAGLAVTPPFFKVDMMDISMGCYAAFTADEGMAISPHPPPGGDDFTKEASPRFDASCDIDKNSVVDMMDISLMCYNFLNEYGDP